MNVFVGHFKCIKLKGPSVGQARGMLWKEQLAPLDCTTECTHCYTGTVWNWHADLKDLAFQKTLQIIRNDSSSKWRTLNICVLHIHKLGNCWTCIVGKYSWTQRNNKHERVVCRWMHIACNMGIGWWKTNTILSYRNIKLILTATSSKQGKNHSKIMVYFQDLSFTETKHLKTTRFI